MGNVLVVSVATPLTSATALPSGVAPFRKVTVPVGRDAAEDTVAVSVTGLVVRTVAAEEVSETSGVAWLTFSVTLPAADF